VTDLKALKKITEKIQKLDMKRKEVRLERKKYATKNT